MAMDPRFKKHICDDAVISRAVLAKKLVLLMATVRDRNVMTERQIDALIDLDERYCVEFDKIMDEDFG